MRKLKLISIAAVLLSAPSLAMAEGPLPSKIAEAEAAGPAFEGAAARHAGPVSYVEALTSADGKFKAGLYRTGPGELVVEAYPDDEFCLILSGEARLISADGTTLELKSGDSAFIPKGWKGRWSTTGFSKYYALYTGTANAAAD